MMPRKLRALGGALALAGLLAAAPAVAGVFDDEVARKQIAEQQKKVDELRQQTTDINARLAKIEDGAKSQSQPVLALVSEI